METPRRNVQSARQRIVPSTQTAPGESLSADALVIVADVLHLKALRQIEIKLHRGQLPVAPYRIFDAYIYLGTVKTASSFNSRVWNLARVQSVNERRLSFSQSSSEPRYWYSDRHLLPTAQP